MDTLFLLVIRGYLLAFVHMHFRVFVKNLHYMFYSHTRFDMCMIKMCKINKCDELLRLRIQAMQSKLVFE